MGTIVQTTELSDEKITSIPPELAVDSLILVRQFVEWQLERHNLKFGLVVPNTGIMATVVGRSDRLPKVFLPDYLVNQNKDKIVERSRQGCTVVFSSMNTGHEVIEFFEGFHFSSSGTSKSELEKAPVLETAWNKKELLLTLEYAYRLGSQTLCFFDHDADPIYIISKDGY